MRALKNLDEAIPLLHFEDELVLGLPVAAVARPHTIEGLVAAVERGLRPRRRSPTKEH